MLKEYLASAKGKGLILSLVSKFLEGKGLLGSMMGMFVQPDAIAEMIRTQFLEQLQRDEIKEQVNLGIHQMVNQILDTPFSKLTGYLDDSLKTKGALFIVEQVMGASFWSKPIKELPIVVLINWLQKDGIKKTASAAIRYLLGNIEAIFSTVNVRGIVTEEVNKIPLEKLERMVLSISGKEFKMITILGYALGGIIGLVQGILFTVL